MTAAERSGRPNQTNRTRKDLLQAASRLLKRGDKLTLEDIAEEAGVSRATAYRYFSSVDALIVEAPIDGAVPDPDEVFSNSSDDDPVERLVCVETALHEMISTNEPALRLLLAHSLQGTMNGNRDNDLPVRQNRRTALIEAALAPARRRFKPADLKTLTTALALIMGTESMVVFKDVLQMDDKQARAVRRWAIRALVQAALRDEDT
jgi:AcrR family transcriptional regulator